jgi:hypothetical protein
MRKAHDYDELDKKKSDHMSSQKYDAYHVPYLMLLSMGWIYILPLIIAVLYHNGIATSLWNRLREIALAPAAWVRANIESRMMVTVILVLLYGRLLLTAIHYWISWLVFILG